MWATQRCLLCTSTGDAALWDVSTHPTRHAHTPYTWDVGYAHTPYTLRVRVRVRMEGGRVRVRMQDTFKGTMGWLWSVGSIKLYVSFVKEPCKRDIILQTRAIIVSILLSAATPCVTHTPYTLRVRIAVRMLATSEAAY